MLAKQKEVDPKLSEEDTVLESSLNQITLLFHERAIRLEKLQRENQRIQSRHLEAVTGLESEVMNVKDMLEEKHLEKASLLRQKLDGLQSKLEKLEVSLMQSKEQRERLEVTKKEEITSLKQ